MNDPQALEKLQRKGKKPMTDRTALELAVAKVLSADKWPICRDYDDAGLSERHYCEFVAEVIAAIAAPQPAVLPVRCDRCGSSGDTFVLCAGCHSVTEQSKNPQPETEEAMFMLQDMPGATLVERVARLSKWYLDLREFPYQQTFDAIAMAVELWPSKDAAFGISISVRKFQEAFNNHRDATRSYADRAQSATAFDPELQADGDAER